MVVAAGALGTNQLLAAASSAARCPGSPTASATLVRTNSESILAVTAPDDSRDFARSIAITSSIYPDPDTHIEVVTYGRAGDAMSFLFTLLTGSGHEPDPPAAVARPGGAPPDPPAADAVAVQVVAAHGDPARHADARQRDPAAVRSAACSAAA